MSARGAVRWGGGDRARRRVLVFVAGAAAAGAAVAMVVIPSGASAPGTRPLARPHERAGLACASCHGAEGAAAPAAACVTCHAAASHPLRAAHRPVAVACASCHPAHEGAQGIAFERSGAVRWGTGTGVAETALSPRPDLLGLEVPLVALAACVSCHDPTSARDPIARCIPGGPTRDSMALAHVASTCLDEHGRGAPLPAAAGRCAGQHAPARPVARDLARELATRTAWVASAAPASGGAPWMPLLAGGLGASATALAAWGRARRSRPRAAATPRALPADGRRRLPVVEAATCLGCNACVDACPFDVLAVRSYVAVVARPDECCGVLSCAEVCPNGSLRIHEGEPVDDRPRTDERLESRDVPGLFLAGDLTGLPLIKNAIAQGALAVESIAAARPRARRGVLDVLVVGAGPAGLSAALRAKELGLEAAVVEQATLASSIRGFPRDKIVHEPPHVPAASALWLGDATKEEVVAQWSRIVRSEGLDVREGRRLVGLERDGETFAARVVGPAGDEETLRAARVVLAIGRRGSPRTLELAVSAAAEERVYHALADAQRFAGKSVVVAGLGDAAMEAAIALASQPGTRVTVSYRGNAFGRGKARNIEALEKLVRTGRVAMAFETVPSAMDAASVTLVTTVRGRETREVPADALLVLLGGEAAWDLLERIGIVRPGAASRDA